MSALGEVVKKALETGYLTVDAENKLRQMLKRKCGAQEIGAFMALQKAAMAGQVKQQSRELLLT